MKTNITLQLKKSVGWMPDVPVQNIVFVGAYIAYLTVMYMRCFKCVAETVPIILQLKIPVG